MTRPMPRLAVVAAFVAFVALLLLAAPAPALACPVCDTATGQQVRAGIFDDSFGFNVVATLLPFPILIGVATFIHFGWPRRRS